MIKIKAHFSDGMYNEFDTYLPITKEVDDKILKEYFGMDYVEVESDLDSKKIKELENYVNEEYDLISMNNFSYEVKEWTQKDLDEFLNKIN